MKTILVPTDFSPPAQRALEYVVSLANRTNARIILFHVFSQVVHVELVMEIKKEIKRKEEKEKMRLARLAQEVTMLHSILQGQAMHEMVLAEEEPGLGAFPNFAESAPGSLEIECQACFGLVGEEIIKAAKRKKADLIVMGRRGQRAARAPHWQQYLRGDAPDALSLVGHSGHGFHPADPEHPIYDRF